MEELMLASAVKAAVPYARLLYETQVVKNTQAKILDGLRIAFKRGAFRRGLIAYLSSVYGKCKVASTLAYPLQTIDLEKVYIPLTAEDGRGNSIKFSSENIQSILKKYRRIKLIDNAGMGKSTISKIIVIDSIIRNYGIPFFIELRTCGKDNSIRSIISQSIGIPPVNVNQFLDGNNVILVFDGLDEVGISQRGKIVSEINKMTTDLTNATIIVTSRQIKEVDDILNCERFNLRRLNESESSELIKKYDPGQNFSGQLIQQIHTSRGEIKQFLGVPLYVALLVSAYRHKAEVPTKIHLFIAQLYDALYSGHDLKKQTNWTRGKHCELDQNQLNNILRHLGFYCLREELKVEFSSRSEMTMALDAIRPYIKGFEYVSEKVVGDLIETVPVFVEDGISVKWSHKLLMEYFASLYICWDHENTGAVLGKIIKAKDGYNQYYNVLYFSSELKYPSFRKTVTLDIINKILEEEKWLLENMDKALGGMESGQKIAAIGTFLFNEYAILSESNYKIAKDRDFTKHINDIMPFIKKRWKVKGITFSLHHHMAWNGRAVIRARSYIDKILDLIYDKEVGISYFPVPLEKDKNKILTLILSDGMNVCSSKTDSNFVASILSFNNALNLRRWIINVDTCRRVKNEIEEDDGGPCLSF